MYKTEVNCATGEVTQVPLSPAEMDAIANYVEPQKPIAEKKDQLRAVREGILNRLAGIALAAQLTGDTATKAGELGSGGTGGTSLGFTATDSAGTPARVWGSAAGGAAATLFTPADFSVANAANATNLGGVAASGYARSGANTDITSMAGLTTPLSIAQGGTGANTASAAQDALDPPAFGFLEQFNNFSFSSATFVDIYASSVVVQNRSALSGGAFTASKTGWVRISVGQMYCTLNSGTVNYVAIRYNKNGVSYAPEQLMLVGEYSSYLIVAACNAGDVFKLYGKVSGGGNCNIQLTGVLYEQL